MLSENVDMDRLPPGRTNCCESIHFSGFCKVETHFQSKENPEELALQSFFSRFDSVCILGFNAPEWVISDVAAIFAGGFAAGIYPTNGPEVEKLKNYNIVSFFCLFSVPPRPANIFWSRAVVPSWLLRMEGSWTRFGLSGTSFLT